MGMEAYFFFFFPSIFLFLFLSFFPPFFTFSQKKRFSYEF